MTRFPIVLLDYDGTLAETRPAILRSLMEALAECGMKSRSPALLESELSKGATLAQLFQILMPDGDAEAGQAFIASYRAHYPQADLEETVLYEGATEAIDALHRAGIVPLILSNKHRPSVIAGLKRFGLLDRVAAVLASEPDQPSKPDRRVMTERIQPLFPNAVPKDFLMVGDTVTDIRFACEASIAACWVSYGHGQKEACRALEPTFEIADIRDLPGLLA